MIELVGKYLIEIGDNSVSIRPLPRARIKRVQHHTFSEIYAIEPKYVRDYCYIKTRFCGWIYLIHFHEKYQHAGHYLGFAKNIDQRMIQHIAGRGARLMQVIEEAGISWEISRVWFGDRYLERRLKNQGGASRICPICKERKRNEIQAARVASS